MTLPVSLLARIGSYTVRKELSGKKYPLVLMLEPLLRCNLACPGCGKIDYPDAILNQRLSVQQCMDAIDECGAPAVSIAGGEPLLHRDMPDIVKGYIAKKKFVILHQRATAQEKDRRLQAVDLLHLVNPSRWRQGDARSRGRSGGHL